MRCGPESPQGSERERASFLFGGLARIGSATRAGSTPALGATTRQSLTLSMPTLPLAFARARHRSGPQSYSATMAIRCTCHSTPSPTTRPGPSPPWRSLLCAAGQSAHQWFGQVQRPRRWLGTCQWRDHCRQPQIQSPGALPVDQHDQLHTESPYTDTHHHFELAEHRQRYLAEVQRRLDLRCHLSCLFGWRARPGSRTAPSPQCCLRIADAQISRSVGRPIHEHDYVSDQQALYFARLSRSLIHFCPHHLGGKMVSAGGRRSIKAPTRSRH